MRTVRIATSAALLLAIVASAQTTTNPPFTIKILLAGVTTNGGDGSAIEGKTVAEKYWELYTARKDVRTTLK